MRFDALQSSGDGLSYIIDYGDGASSPKPLTSRVVAWTGQGMTAKLSVTDSSGRTDSTSVDYYVAKVATYSTESWSPRSNPWVVLRLAQDGAKLSGWYSEELNSPPYISNRRLTGTLSGYRGVNLVTEDGAIEMTGTVEWNLLDPAQWHIGPIVMEQWGVTLRLSFRGGVRNGTTLDLTESRILQ